MHACIQPGSRCQHWPHAISSTSHSCQRDLNAEDAPKSGVSKQAKRMRRSAVARVQAGRVRQCTGVHVIETPHTHGHVNDIQARPDVTAYKLTQVSYCKRQRYDTYQLHDVERACLRVQQQLQLDGNSSGWVASTLSWDNTTNSHQKTLGCGNTQAGAGCKFLVMLVIGRLSRHAWECSSSCSSLKDSSG